MKIKVTGQFEEATEQERDTKVLTVFCTQNPVWN
jgi:hypothetical protein